MQTSGDSSSSSAGDGGGGVSGGRGDTIKPNDYSSAATACVPRITTAKTYAAARKYWTARYKEPLYPFSQVLRFRVLQIVCGIIMTVMGSVACIEEKGTITKLGIGVFAGVATVIASAACIHTSRGFGGYRQSSCGGANSIFRFLGPTLHLASLLTCIWLVAGFLNVILLARAFLTIVYVEDEQVSETSYLLAMVQASLSASVLLTTIFIARVDCTYDPD